MLLPLLLTAGPLAAPTPQAAVQDAAHARPAAWAGPTELGWKELDEVLTVRRAMGEDGRAALKHLLKARVLDKLAREDGLVIRDEELDRRQREMEREIAASGQAQNLNDYLGRNGVSLGKFREFLRLALVQETLARRALGIPPAREVPAEQQEAWLGQVLEQRGMVILPPPWADGVAARCADVAVKAGDFLAHLREQLAEEDVREDCYQALLAKRLREKLLDVGPEKLERALDAELERRRSELRADPTKAGMTLEQLLAAQGVAVPLLRQDPAIQCSALAHLWVDEQYGGDGLRAAYQAERERFDGAFGEALEVTILLLRATNLPTQHVPRTYERADSELVKLAAGVTTRERFQELVRAHSEESSTRAQQGSLGFVSRRDERLSEDVLRALYAAADAGQGRAASAPVGPFHLPLGSALFWIGSRRPAPSWETMQALVHRELRRELMEKTLPRSDVVTYLDRE